MKTSFLQKNRRNQNNKQKILITVVIFLIGYGLFSIFNTSVLSGISPLWNLRNEIITKGKNIGSFFKSKNSLIEENQRLRDQINAEESLLYSFRSLQESNNLLLTELGRLPEGAKVAAGILARPPQSAYDILVIDAGENEGLRIGSTTILPFGPAIGTITKISKETSEVTLYSSNGVKTEAVLERGGVPVTLVGQGGGNFEIEVPRDILVVKGDRVLNYGISPRLLGVVEDISEESTDSFKRVSVRTPQSFYSLRFVYVLK